MNSKKVLKRAFSSIVMFFSLSALSAIGVDQSEIQSTEGNEIVFRNYSGPHSVINTIEQIRGIGAEIGNLVRENPTRIGTVGNTNRYAVIHAIDPTTKEKFDADIFIVGRGATVDHITNLRRIISGYLVAAYGYSTKDADTIAAFVTVYNAVYRGNLQYFQSRYKNIVTEKLSPSIVGLSTNYEEWAGNTQVVIPLSDLNGGLSTIDTSLISDKEVIKSMQGDEDKGIDTRKDMVDIKEREADNAQEKADEAQKKADEEKAKLAEEQRKKAEADAAAAKAKADADKAKADADKAKADADKAKADADKAKADADKKKADADAAKKNAADAQKNADQAKKDAKANPDDAASQKKAADAQNAADQSNKDANAAQQEADEAQQNADEAQNKADEAQQNADEAQTKADEAQQNADEAQNKADEQTEKTNEQAENAENAQNKADSEQAKADQKREEAQDERASIAKDQQKLIESRRNMDANTMYGLKNVDDEGVTSQIIKMNPQDGTIIKESPVKVIRARTVFEDGNHFVAIAGINEGNGAIRLVQIDKKNLEISIESAEKISEFSVLVEQGGDFFCTIQDENDFYIGKFNTNVEKLLQSDTKVKAATPISITSAGIMVTDSNGQAVILDPTNLIKISSNSK